MAKSKNGSTIIQEKQWAEFAKQNIVNQISKRSVGDKFLIPLNRNGINNGLSDLGRDGSKGGVKIHAAFVNDLHPEYSVQKICNDTKYKRTYTHLQITILKK